MRMNPADDAVRYVNVQKRYEPRTCHFLFAGQFDAAFSSRPRRFKNSWVVLLVAVFVVVLVTSFIFNGDHFKSRKFNVCTTKACIHTGR